MTRRSSQRALAREIYREMAAQAPSASPQIGRTAQNLTEKARALYENSAVPVAEIARLAGVTERTVYKYAAKENWTPRYRWSAAGGRPRGTRWRAGAALAPAKGTAGRFIRRADKGKPICRWPEGRRSARCGRRRGGLRSRGGAGARGAGQGRTGATRRGDDLRHRYGQ